MVGSVDGVEAAGAVTMAAVPAVGIVDAFDDVVAVGPLVGASAAEGTSVDLGAGVCVDVDSDEAAGFPVDVVAGVCTSCPNGSINLGAEVSVDLAAPEDCANRAAGVPATLAATSPGKVPWF